MPNARVVVMGSFVADLAFRTPRLPSWGETVLGTEFRLGPGGKGSNQAVAAARLGANISFICKLGRDAFGDLARRTYAQDGVDTRFVFETLDHATGGATIIIDQASGENAIVVVPGSCFTLNADDIDNARDAIAGAAVFMTQLELPLASVEHGLRLAKSLGAATILNPARRARCPSRSIRSATTRRRTKGRRRCSPARAIPSARPRRCWPAASATSSSPSARRARW